MHADWRWHCYFLHYPRRRAQYIIGVNAAAKWCWPDWVLSSCFDGWLAHRPRSAAGARNSSVDFWTSTSMRLSAFSRNVMPYSNRRVSFMRTCDCRILRLLLHLSHISAKCAYRIFFPHKLAFSTAILVLFVSILPVSIRFRYLNHLVANGMAPSMCPEYSGPLWSVERGGVVGFEQFCTIFPHISAAYLVFMRSAYFFNAS